MSATLTNLFYKSLNKYARYLRCNEKRAASLKAAAKQQEARQLIIGCKRKSYNLYSDQTYNKLDEIPLASKGWNHSKSRGDHFTIYANLQDIDHPAVPFQELNIHDNLIKVLNEQGITLATAFQSEVIPAIESSKHVLVAAETGCGKTIAYLLPVIQNLMGTRCEAFNTPKALILTPNRELVHQIGAITKLLAQSVDLNVKVLVGGHTKRIMLSPEFENIDILVATPGAIGKLSTVGIYKLNEVMYTVLDEADTLLDDTFHDRLSTLLKRVSQSQVTLVSATQPKKLPDYLEPIESNLIYLRSPRLHKPLFNITQKFMRLPISGRPSYLLQIAKNAKDPLLIFTNRNETSNWLAMFLRENGLKCSNINGDMNYDIRIQQWSDFSKGYTNILSSTDVASRGLDTIQVKHVVNYDFPLYAADYIHRVGRTGRLGSSQSSKVTNFISGAQEIKLVQQIELAIRKNMEIPNVDGNIRKLVEHKILKRIRESG